MENLIPNKREDTEILSSRFDQIFNDSLTPIVEATEGKEADEKMMEDGESKVGSLMCFGYNKAKNNFVKQKSNE